MKYITETLGVKVVNTTWDKTNKLPYFLIYEYEIKKMYLNELACLFITPKKELNTIQAVKKHIEQIQKVENCPVVLILDRISYKRRQSLIKYKIPFIVDDKQMYLPFMGLILQERFALQKVMFEKLKPSAQMLLFYFLYGSAKKLYQNQVVKKFGFSATSITRAVYQLKEAGLVSVCKDGIENVLYSEFTAKEIFEKARQYLINPVRKKIYIRKEILPLHLPKAGLTALSEKTMLNPPMLTAYACTSDTVPDKYDSELIDANEQAEIEVWKYNPCVLSADGIADPLSLAISLEDNNDERVEQMIENMLEKLWVE